MTQKELVRAIADATSVDQQTVASVLSGLANVTQEAIAAGERVQVSGLFTAETTQRAERQGRNPRTGESITIAARRAVKLTPAAALKRAAEGE